MTAESIHAALQNVAQRVDQSSWQAWNVVRSRYRRLGGRPARYETSITDWVLMLLEGHQVIEYYQFNQHEEPMLGADWEWWIGSDSFGWRCARIQAKRVYPAAAGPTYEQLDHEIGEHGDRQLDVLIRSCEQGLDPTGTRKAELQGIIRPYYAFYNGWPRSAFPHNEDLAGIAANEAHIAAHSARRTDRPQWGDWAQTRRLHYLDCRPQLVMLATDRRCRWGHTTQHAPLRFREFDPSPLPFWGISALPADDVRKTFNHALHPKKASPYLAASIPISTILFDVWVSLNKADNRIARLPDYAEAVRRLSDPDSAADRLGRLDDISSDDRFSIPTVAITDVSSPLQQ